MKKNSVIDYLGCAALKLLGPLLRLSPMRLNLFVGRRLGELFYYFDLRHKAVAYANIRFALGSELTPRQLSRVTRDFYRNLGQNIIEFFIIPLIDKKYMEKYVYVEGKEHIEQAFSKGKGVILMGVHAGSWELSNLVCSNLGFAFNLLVNEQAYPRLNQLLNDYRRQKGCKIIDRGDKTRQLVLALKNNEAVGMTADQGGKTGMQVKFFGKYASMPTGAVKCALRYGAVILPAFYTRVREQYHKVIIAPPLELSESGDREKDLRVSLQKVASVFENLIRRYPQEYLWTYKIWKYSTQRNILILSDGKAGHFKQSQALSRVVGECFKERGIDANIQTIEIKFRRALSSGLLTLSTCFAGKYNCQGCLWCLRKFLDESVYKLIIASKPDVVISCGSSLAPLNYVISRETRAKSMVIMRPSILSTRRFDLVIAPRHDGLGRRPNTVIIDGALNLMDAAYLKSSADRLSAEIGINRDFVVGLLIGGNTKDFDLDLKGVKEVIKALKDCLEKLDGQILITTSRRTPPEVEKLLKEEFEKYPRTALLLIANEKNFDYAVAGILGLSKVVVLSPDSISMVSEAAASGRYVFVFHNKDLTYKYISFINHLNKGGYVYLGVTETLCARIQEIYKAGPPVKTLDNWSEVRGAVANIL